MAMIVQKMAHMTGPRRGLQQANAESLPVACSSPQRGRYAPSLGSHANEASKLILIVEVLAIRPFSHGTVKLES